MRGQSYDFADITVLLLTVATLQRLNRRGMTTSRTVMSPTDLGAAKCRTATQLGASSPFRRRGQRACRSILLWAAAATCPESSAPAQEPGTRATLRPVTASKCTVSRVIDGDTLECGRNEKIRLIGIDAPERAQKPFGPDALKALESLLPVGSQVKLELDTAPVDRYRRVLAYVWLGDTLVNERMVHLGWAISVDYPPNTRYSARLHAANQEAKRLGRGVWANGAMLCLPTDFRGRRC